MMQSSSVLQAIRETAKQTITIVPIIQTAYFAVISISDLRQVIFGQWFIAILFILPALLWGISLFWALKVISPTKVTIKGGQSVDDAEKAIENKKYSQMKTSQYIMLAGFVVMAICVFLYLVLIPLPKEQPGFPPVFAIGTPTPTPNPSPTATPMPTNTMTPYPTVISTPSVIATLTP